MTEKRFVLYEHKGEKYILDTPDTELDFIEMLGDCLDEEGIVDLLNELTKENLELQGKAASWKITASEEISKQADLVKQIISLKKENQELKRTINRISEDYEESHGMDIRNAEWFTAW